MSRNVNSSSSSRYSLHWNFLGSYHKHNNLPLGPIQPSSPSTKELHGSTNGLDDQGFRW